jgi:hypothetical protein
MAYKTRKHAGSRRKAHRGGRKTRRARSHRK